MVLDQNVKREIIYIHTELKSWIPVLFRLYLQNWETFGKNRQLLMFLRGKSVAVVGGTWEVEIFEHQRACLGSWTLQPPKFNITQGK